MLVSMELPDLQSIIPRGSSLVNVCVRFFGHWVCIDLSQNFNDCCDDSGKQSAIAKVECTFLNLANYFVMTDRS